mgnify:CR=1 FL=1
MKIRLNLRKSPNFKGPDLQCLSDIVDPLLKEFSAMGINYLQPLSATAQQARKIDTDSTL